MNNNIEENYMLGRCERCVKPDEETSGLVDYYGNKYCLECINYKMKNEYKPIITHRECDGILKECCVCLDEKLCETGIFHCIHNSLCGSCHLKLNNKSCPLCRADFIKPILHPMSQLIIRFKKYHKRYPWNISKKYMKERYFFKKNAPSLFTYFAFKWIKEDKESKNVYDDRYNSDDDEEDYYLTI